jgi:hypothetical protein
MVSDSEGSESESDGEDAGSSSDEDEKKARLNEKIAEKKQARMPTALKNMKR